jgi:putative CocE/NonD family hydrolase
MRTHDGAVLRADVWRPPGRGPFPVLLVRTPYDKTLASTINYAHPGWYAAQGYLVVLQDVRGRWRSDGEFTPFEHEQADGHQAIEWAASLPGANGRVGMYGGSYVGATQLLSARGAPPALQAIAPGVTASQYHDGWTYQQGALAIGFASTWACELAGDQARRAGDEGAWRMLMGALATPGAWLSYLPLREHPPLLAGGYAPFYLDWLAHPSYDEYWRRWSIEEDYGAITAPALNYGGWYDAFARGTVRNFGGLEGNGSALLMGPWAHVAWSPRVGAVDHGARAAAEIDQAHLRWFDRWLRDHGPADAAPVRVFVMGLDDWLEESTWPPAGVRRQALFLRSGGRANSVRGDGALAADPPGEQDPDRFVYDPLSPIASYGGHSCCYPEGSPIGPADQAAVESSGRVLVYTGPPLERRLLVLGPVTVVLHAATDRLDTDFTARLCDVDATGHSINLLEGVIRARYRDSLSDPSPVEPGAVYEYHLDLGPIAHAFLPGHRVRLQVGSSDFPQWDRNLNTGGPFGDEGPMAALLATQTVFHESGRPSRLLLSVAEG